MLKNRCTSTSHHQRMDRMNAYTRDPKIIIQNRLKRVCLRWQTGTSLCLHCAGSVVVWCLRCVPYHGSQSTHTHTRRTHPPLFIHTIYCIPDKWFDFLLRVIYLRVNFIIQFQYFLWAKTSDTRWVIWFSASYFARIAFRVRHGLPCAFSRTRHSICPLKYSNIFFLFRSRCGLKNEPKTKQAKNVGTFGWNDERIVSPGRMNLIKMFSSCDEMTSFSIAHPMKPFVISLNSVFRSVGRFWCRHEWAVILWKVTRTTAHSSLQDRTVLWIWATECDGRSPICRSLVFQLWARSAVININYYLFIHFNKERAWIRPALVNRNHCGRFSAVSWWLAQRHERQDFRLFLALL